MFRSAIAALAGGLALTAATAALAQSARSYDDWRFTYGTVAGLADQACTASTRAGRVSLFLAATPSWERRPTVYTVISDPRWNIAPVRKSYRVEFDDGAWTMHGHGSGSEVVVQWSNLGNFLTFMEDIASGELATLRANDGTVLAIFSLEGSRSATIDLETCVKGRGIALAEEDLEVRDIQSLGGTRDPF